MSDQNNVAMFPVSRREANKRDKLTRIRAAARDVFLEKGFSDANLREIAVAAHVGFGTLFLYAKNKQDMLLLLYDEELPVVAQRALRKAWETSGFLDQAMAFFRELYDFYLETPQLSRDMLREITFRNGIVANRMWESIKDIERDLARLVAKAQADGDVNSSIAPDLAAHVIFSLYRVELRVCMDAEEPVGEPSLERLRRQLEVVLIGLSMPQSVAARLTPSLTRGAVDRTPSARGKTHP